MAGLDEIEGGAAEEVVATAAVEADDFVAALAVVGFLASTTLFASSRALHFQQRYTNMSHKKPPSPPLNSPKNRKKTNRLAAAGGAAGFFDTFDACFDAFDDVEAREASQSENAGFSVALSLWICGAIPIESSAIVVSVDAGVDGASTGSEFWATTSTCSAICIH